MKVPKDIRKDRFDIGNLRMLFGMKVDSNVTFIAVASL